MEKKLGSIKESIESGKKVEEIVSAIKEQDDTNQPPKKEEPPEVSKAIEQLVAKACDVEEADDDAKGDDFLKGVADKMKEQYGKELEERKKKKGKK